MYIYIYFEGLFAVVVLFSTLFIFENQHFTIVFKQKFSQFTRICSPNQIPYSRSPDGDIMPQL